MKKFIMNFLFVFALVGFFTTSAEAQTAKKTPVYTNATPAPKTKAQLKEELKEVENKIKLNPNVQRYIEYRERLKKQIKE